VVYDKVTLAHPPLSSILTTWGRTVHGQATVLGSWRSIQASSGEKSDVGKAEVVPSAARLHACRPSIRSRWQLESMNASPQRSAANVDLC